MANKISVLIDVTIDKAAKSLKDFRTAISEADGVTNKFKAGGKAAFEGVKANAGAMAVGAIGSVVAFSGSIIKAGAEMEAMDAKSETVFGGSIGRIRKWAEASASAMGLTAREAINAGAGIADLLKPMGFSEEAATDNAVALMDLSGALSAWSGGQRSAAEVSQIFTKAMLGEREELKSLGISISEADVQQRLLEKGQQSLTGATLAQAKAVATQELIFEKSADAQKAWADGSMDGVKSQNEARSAVTRLGEVVNESLYPVLVKLVPVIAETAEGLIPLAEQLDTVVDLFGQVAPALNLTATSGEKLTAQLRDLESEFRKADAIDLYNDLMVSAALNSVTYEDILSKLDKAQAEYAKTVETATGTFKTGADIQAEYEKAAADVADQLKDSGGRAEYYASRVDAANEATEDFKRELQAADQALSKLKGNLDERAAWRNLEDSLESMAEKIASGEATFRELEESTDGARSAAADYIEQSTKIPTEVKTQLFQELDQGSMDAVLAFLDGLQRGVDLPIRPKVVGQNASLVAIGSGGVIPRFDSGGVMPGPRGEHNLAMVAGGETILPTHKPGATGSLGGGMNVTINVPNADPQAVVRAIEEAKRRYGTGFLR